MSVWIYCTRHSVILPVTPLQELCWMLCSHTLFALGSWDKQILSKCWTLFTIPSFAPWLPGLHCPNPQQKHNLCNPFLVHLWRGLHQLSVLLNEASPEQMKVGPSSTGKKKSCRVMYPILRVYWLHERGERVLACKNVLLKDKKCSPADTGHLRSEM